MTTIENQQVVNQPNLYINGLLISNDATTPNTKLNVAAGQCRDSQNQSDIVVGNYLSETSSSTANVSTTIDFSVNGLNGLDTGSIGATKMYYIYAISDPSGFRAPGCIASLSLPATGPLVPFGYGLQRYIGAWPSDGSSHLLKGYYQGSGASRSFYYDASRASGITAGASNTYAIVDLINLIPFLNNTPAIIQTNFTANAAADTLNLQPQSGTGDAVLVIAQVAGATAHIVNINKVLAQVVTTTVGINYKVSAGTLAVNVNGYDVNL